MTIGPRLIFECPACKRLVFQPTLGSGNTIDAKRYSDGKVIAPFFPSFADLVRCQGCSIFFRLSTLKPLGSYKAPYNRYAPFLRRSHELQENKQDSDESFWDPGLITIFNGDKHEYLKVNKDDTHPWMETDRAEFLSFTEYLEVFQRYAFVDKADEEKTRTELWWLFNDRVRKGEPMFESSQDETLWRQNLERLLQLIDLFYIPKRFKAAEIHRSLGNFDAAMEILSTITNPSQQLLVEFFTKACESKQTELLEIV
jgi:hypothetical protein